MGKGYQHYKAKVTNRLKGGIMKIYILTSEPRHFEFIEKRRKTTAL